MTGFVGGTYNRFGRYYAVRQGDAHSWVEAYLDDPIHGWVTFDPTPTSGAQPLQETAGAWVYFRDVLEALAALEPLRHRLRPQDAGPHLRRPLTALRAVPHEDGRQHGHDGEGDAPSVVAGALIVAFIGAYILWRRKRTTKTNPTDSSEKTRIDPARRPRPPLYRMLEIALSARGIARPAALPPLKHAEDPSSATTAGAARLRAHESYIEAYFGGVAIDDATRGTEYERRVKEIRGFKARARAATQRDGSRHEEQQVFGALPAIEVEPAAVPDTNIT